MSGLRIKLARIKADREQKEAVPDKKETDGSDKASIKTPRTDKKSGLESVGDNTPLSKRLRLTL